MRSGSITINGVEYPLRYSTRVACNTQEQYGGLHQLGEAIASEDVAVRLRAITWTLAQMLDAGARYCRLSGEASPEPVPSQDDLCDLFGPEDLIVLVRAINATISQDAERKVEAEPPKNLTATGGA